VVSHDLRNPLTGILAGGWALERLDLSPQASNIARRIVAAGGRMERLVRDLLDWSRAQRGAPIPISTREADLHEVCLRIADEFQARNVNRIRVDREGDARATFDPDRVEQVVGNLLSNALRYAPSGTAVVVRVVGTPDDVRLEVHDEGAGIPADAQAHIFEPFQRPAAAQPGAASARRCDASRGSRTPVTTPAVSGTPRGWLVRRARATT
jgi:signal transduction histidine kinase